MNELQKVLTGLRMESQGLKTSQLLGGTNFCVLYQEKKLSFELANTNRMYWVYFDGKSDFPLVNLGFVIKEDGVVVTPKTYQISGNSRGTYYLNYNWGAELASVTLPSYDLFAKNIFSTFLTCDGTGQTGLVEITIKCKSSCEGVLKVEVAKQ